MHFQSPEFHFTNLHKIYNNVSRLSRQNQAFQSQNEAKASTPCEKMASLDSTPKASAKKEPAKGSSYKTDKRRRTSSSSGTSASDDESESDSSSEADSSSSGSSDTPSKRSIQVVSPLKEEF